MAETPDEAYERTLAEEQAKGSSPQVAQARAKAARMRTSKGLSTNPAEAAKEAAAAEHHAPAAAAPPAPAAVAPAAAASQPAAAAASTPAPSGEAPEAVFERVLAEEQAKGSSPAVAQARAKAARMRASKGTAAPAPPAPVQVPVGAGVGATAAAAAAAATAAAPVAKGRGAAARAARAAGTGEAVPERIQRLLAVVKPEAIQRVEKEPIDRVNTWPHLMASEMLAILAATLVLVLVSVVINAPFRELANINQTPNPSKAPWYFLGLQELLRYFHPQIAGVTIPQWIILGLMAAPFIDRNPSTKPNDRKVAITLFTIFMVFFAVLVSIGVLFRGPGQNWVYPWKDGLFYLRNLNPLGEHGFEL